MKSLHHQKDNVKRYPSCLNSWSTKNAIHKTKRQSKLPHRDLSLCHLTFYHKILPVYREKSLSQVHLRIVYIGHAASEDELETIPTMNTPSLTPRKFRFDKARRRYGNRVPSPPLVTQRPPRSRGNLHASRVEKDPSTRFRSRLSSSPAP